jgi:hypothetical protein
MAWVTVVQVTIALRPGSYWREEWEHRFHCADKTISTNLLSDFPEIFVLNRTMGLNGYQEEGDPYGLAIRSDDRDNIVFDNRQHPHTHIVQRQKLTHHSQQHLYAQHTL